MTSYKDFVWADPHGTLPVDFQNAIQASADNTQTDADDDLIGSAIVGEGYCSQPQYERQVYCSCVNAPVAYPECIFKPCSNSARAYKTVQMRKVMDNAQKLCPTSVNCTQVFEMGGEDNIASGVSQVMNCGGVVETFVTNIQAHPFLAVVLLILVLSVLMLFSGPPAPAKRTLLPIELQVLDLPEQ
jgi:hypothetical protein